jgi:hypothetical protein
VSRQQPSYDLVNLQTTFWLLSNNNYEGAVKFFCKIVALLHKRPIKSSRVLFVYLLALQLQELLETDACQFFAKRLNSINAQISPNPNPLDGFRV